MYFVLLGIATYNSSEILLLNANLERGTTVGMGLQNIKRAMSIVLHFKISNCFSLRSKHIYKKSEDTKRVSESVYRRRTDNTMAKRKSTKGQTTIDKTCI